MDMDVWLEGSNDNGSIDLKKAKVVVIYDKNLRYSHKNIYFVKLYITGI